MFTILRSRRQVYCARKNLQLTDLTVLIKSLVQISRTARLAPAAPWTLALRDVSACLSLVLVVIWITVF